jgi:gliding motility-associated-like protein
VKDINNIDELLKDRMQDFTPDVPADVWTQISSNLGSGAAPTSINPISGLSIAVKTSIIVGIVAVASASYFLLGGIEKPAVSEKNIQTQTTELPKSENTAATPILESPKEASKTEVLNFPKAKLIPSAELKDESNVHAINKEIQFESEKVNKPETQDPIIPKFDNLVSKDAKTEVVEGNPETETDEEVKKDEVNPIEPENKKDYPVVNNAFSPNGDGVNDELVIEMPAVDFYHLRIFTKKGVLVFETENVNVKWKGMILGSGQLAENGDYRYIIEYQLKGKENVKAIGGFIFLNR